MTTHSLHHSDLVTGGMPERLLPTPTSQQCHLGQAEVNVPDYSNLFCFFAFFHLFETVLRSHAGLELTLYTKMT